VLALHTALTPLGCVPARAATLLADCALYTALTPLGDVYVTAAGSSSDDVLALSIADTTRLCSGQHPLGCAGLYTAEKPLGSVFLYGQRHWRCSPSTQHHSVRLGSTERQHALHTVAIFHSEMCSAAATLEDVLDLYTALTPLRCVGAGSSSRRCALTYSSNTTRRCVLRRRHRWRCSCPPLLRHSTVFITRAAALDNRPTLLYSTNPGMCSWHGRQYLKIFRSSL
jgi:hypothetical protein